MLSNNEYRVPSGFVNEYGVFLPSSNIFQSGFRRYSKSALLDEMFSILQVVVKVSNMNDKGIIRIYLD